MVNHIVRVHGKVTAIQELIPGIPPFRFVRACSCYFVYFVDLYGFKKPDPRNHTKNNRSRNYLCFVSLLLPQAYCQLFLNRHRRAIKPGQTKTAEVFVVATPLIFQYADGDLFAKLQ